MSASPAPTRLRVVSINGARVRVSVRGEGRPLLLVMGIGASLDMWDRFERLMIERGYQTISFDLPGAGGSPALFPPRRMGGLARIAIGVLDELGLDVVDVLGVSFGGVVAQEIARRSPGRVRRLVLAATGPGLGGLPAHPRVLLHMATPHRYWSPEYAQRIAPLIYGGQARRDAAQHGRMSARFDRPPTLYGYVSQLFAISGWTSMHWLHRVKVPTLVMSGDDDPIIPLPNGRILARLMPNAELYVVAGGGHLFLLDQTEESAERVDRFLGSPD